MRRFRKSGLILWLLSPCLASANGFQTVEQGTWDMGRAVVGAVSAADSAATSFYNPAAMTLLQETELVAGAMGVLVNSDFEVGPGTTFTGGDGKNAGDNVVTPTGPFFVHPINEEWALGVSLTAPFIGSLDYGRTWAGRYIIRSIDLASYRLAPSVGYRVNDWLSVGATAGINYTKLDIKTAIPTLGADGVLEIDDADEWQFSWGLSAMIEPREGTRLGISYFSEVENDDLGGDLDVSVPGPPPGFSGSADLEFTLPQALAASLRQEVTDDLLVFVDFAWVDWSAFKHISIDGSGALVSINASTHFSDAVAFGLGAEYRLNPQWTLSAGISYAGSPVHDKDRNPSLPFDRQIRYGGGVRYAWRDDVTVAFSYEFLDLGDADVNTTFGGGTLEGDFDPNHAHFLALTVSKRF